LDRERSPVGVRLAQSCSGKSQRAVWARSKVTNEPARGNIMSGYPGSICVAIARKFGAGSRDAAPERPTKFLQRQKKDTTGAGTMASFTSSANFLAGSILVCLAGVVLSEEAAAQQKASVPDFYRNGVGWYGVGDFIAVPGSPAPVSSNPAYPYVPNGTGRQPTYRISDITNPNLKPWVKDFMKKDNDEVLAGKIGFTARSSCMPAGVPAFMNYGGFQPLFFVQTPKVVWLIHTGNQEVRRIYLDVAHSQNPNPSWYGESVGHYEGDTLIVDTIGMNDKTFVDYFRTPHTTKLHVVERWKVIENGRTLEVTFTVDDPDAFNEPWSAIRRYRGANIEMRAQQEEICAENNQHLFDYHIPVAKKADF
jgi:hypothetical protein